MTEKTNQDHTQSNRIGYLQTVDRRKYIKAVGAAAAGGALVGASAQPAAASKQGEAGWYTGYGDMAAGCYFAVFEAMYGGWEKADGTTMYSIPIVMAHFPGTEDGSGRWVDHGHIDVSWDASDADYFNMFVDGEDWLASTGDVYHTTDYYGMVEDGVLMAGSFTSKALATLRYTDWVYDYLTGFGDQIDEAHWGYQVEIDYSGKEMGGTAALMICETSHGDYVSFDFEDYSRFDVAEVDQWADIGIAPWGPDNIHVNFADRGQDWDRLW